ncbi:hypothetical protein D3C85_1122580 [compost metagenome]
MNFRGELLRFDPHRNHVLANHGCLNDRIVSATPGHSHRGADLPSQQFNGLLYSQSGSRHAVNLQNVDVVRQACLTGWPLNRPNEMQGGT